ncbi:MAG: FAD-binding oxidoreductase [Fimbriimonadaceae bacterium]
MVTAKTTLQLSEALEGDGPYWIVGSESRLSPPAGVSPIRVEISGLSMISAPDLVCVAGAGTPIAELQAELAAIGLEISCWESSGTLGGAISTNGEWRNLVLGLTIVQADGTIAKSGSRVVKSVAGYDAHKLYIGSYGAFGVIAEVALRVTALGSMRAAEPKKTDLNKAELMLLKNAKEILDPKGKLNPGVLDLI